jgi:hypothetical protein
VVELYCEVTIGYNLRSGKSAAMFGAPAAETPWGTDAVAQDWHRSQEYTLLEADGAGPVRPPPPPTLEPEIHRVDP